MNKRRNAKMNQIHIRYGDIIQFKFENDGQIMSTGIHDNNLQLQQQDDNKPCPNQQDFNFKVLTKIDFESKVALNKFNEDKRLNRLQMDEEDMLIMERLLKKRAEKEAVNNQLMIAQKDGRVLVQGDQIILKHQVSGKYLRIDDTHFIKDQRTCKVQLSDEIDEKCIFVVSPGYEFRIDGHQVQKGDLVILYNEKTDRYFHVGKENSFKISRDPFNRQKIRKFSHPEPWIKKEVIEQANLQECNAMQDEFRNIKLTVILQRPYESEKDLIFAGDIVRLFHTDHKGQLCSELVFEDEKIRDRINKNPVFVRCQENKTSEDEIEQQHCGTLQEVEQWNNQEVETNMVDRESYGRPLMYQGFDGSIPKFSLKHLITGSFVYSDHNIEDLKIPVLTSAVDNSINIEDQTFKRVNNQSLIVFHSRNQNKSNFIKQNDNVQIENKQDIQDDNAAIKDNIWLSDLKDITKLENKREDDQKEEEGKPEVMEGQTEAKKFFEPTTFLNKKEVKRLLSQDKTANNKDTQCIIQTPNEYSQKIKKVLEAISTFKRFVAKLRDREKDDRTNFKDKEITMKMEERIDSMIYFIFDIQDNQRHNYGDTNTIEEIPVKLHQKIFKELHLAEAMVDILFQSVKFFNIFEANLIPIIFKTLNKIQRLIRFMVQDQEINQQQVSQWMNLFFSHINPTLLFTTTEGKKKFLLLKPETVLTLIQSNNIEILKKVEDQQIELIIHYLCENEPHERQFNILSSMCICNKNPIIVKQKAISGILTRNNNEVDSKISWDVDIDSSNEENKLLIKIHSQKLPTEFNDDFVQKKDNNVQTKELTQQYSFLLSYIDLLTALSSGSFIDGVKLAKKKFPMDKIISILKMPLIHYKFKVKLIELCQKIYLDGYIENITIEYKNRTFTHMSISNGDAELYIRQNEKNEKDINKLKDLIKFILMGKKKSISNPSGTSIHQHQVCNSILKLFRRLFDYGFVVTHQEVSYFSAIIIHNLDKSFDYTGKVIVERYKPTQDNMIIFENKKMMCDILNDVLSIRINIVNQYFLHIMLKDSLIEELEEIQEPIDNFFELNSKNEQLLESKQSMDAMKLKLESMQTSEDEESRKKQIEKKVEFLLFHKPYWDLINSIEDSPIRTTIFNKNQLKILSELLKYQDNEMLNKVLTLLFREFKFKIEVADNLRQNNIIESDNQSENIYQFALKVKWQVKLCIRSLKNFLLSPIIETFNKTSIEILKLSKLLRFLIVFAFHNEDSIISRAAQPKPDEQEVQDQDKDREKDGHSFKFEKRYLEFLTNWSDTQVQNRWFTVYGNLFIHESILEFLLNHALFHDVKNIKYMNSIDNKHLRYLSFVKVHICNFLIIFAKVSETNRKLLLPYLDRLVELGDCEKNMASGGKNEREIDMHFYYNYICLEIIQDDRQMFNLYAKRILKHFCVLIIKQYQEFINNAQATNWEIIVSVDCLRRIIYFKNEEQKELQILILNYLESQQRNFNQIETMIKRFKEDILIFVKREGESDPEEKKKNLYEYIRESKKEGRKVQEKDMNTDWMFDSKPLDIPFNILLYERSLVLLVDLVSGKNEATESQIKKIFNLEIAKQLYINCGIQFVPKWIIILLMVNLFFDSDKEDNQIMNQILEFIKLYEIEIQRAQEITERGSDTASCSKYRLLRQNSLTREYSFIDQLNFITNCIVPFCYILILKLHHENLEDLTWQLYRLQKSMAMDYNIFNEFNECFEYIIQRFFQNDTREEIKFLANEVFNVKQTQDWSTAKLRDNINKDFIAKITVKPMRISRFMNNLERKVLTRLSILEKNELYKRELKEDFMSLVRYLSEEVDDKENIFRKVINILNQGNKVLKEDIVINLLILLRKIIENQNKTKTVKEIFLWESQDCEQEKPIQDKQIQLYNFHACDTLFKVFYVQDDILVRDECIKFAIAMLYSGNEIIQGWFLKKFETREKDQFVGVLIELIEKNFDIIQKQEVSKVSTFLEKAFMIDDEEVSEDEDQEAEIDESVEYDVDTQFSMDIVIRILRFLQLLCENHNINLQDKMRTQQTGKKYDLVILVAQQFSKQLKIFHKRNINLGIQTLNTMIEMIQGPNKKNQKELVDEKVVDNIRDIMVLMKDNDENLKKKNIAMDDKYLIQFNTRIMILLTSLLEGNSNKELTYDIQRSCEFSILIDRLKNIFLAFCANDLQLKLEEKSLETLMKEIKIEQTTNHYLKGMLLKEGFNITILMLKIIEVVDSAKSYIQTFSEPLDKVAFDFFKKNIGNVEVALDDDLFMIYQPILPVCNHLSQSTKTLFEETVNRENQVSKISGIIDNYPQFLKEMQINEDINNQSKTQIINFINPKIASQLSSISFFIAVIQNIMIIFIIQAYRCQNKVIFVSNDEDENGLFDTVRTWDQGECPHSGTCFKNICHQPYFSIISSEAQFTPSSPSYLIAKLLFGIVQTFTSVFLFLIWYSTQSEIVMFKFWHQMTTNNRERQRREQKAKGKDNNEIKTQLNNVSPAHDLQDDQNIENECLRLKGPFCTEFMLNHEEITGNPQFYNLYNKLLQDYYNIYSVVIDTNFVQMVFQILFSVMGNVVHEFFYFFHLQDVIKRQPSLQNVIKSVTLNASELTLTVIFMFMINQVLSGVAFIFFDKLQVIEEFNKNSERDQPCEQMIFCFSQTMNFGLKNGGGVGDVILVPEDINSQYYLDFVFKMFQFFFINVLLLNVIFGTIINTFADLRNNRMQQELDMKNNCFICTLNRDEIDRLGTPFEQHVEHVHNTYYYVQQLVHMDQKSTTEYDGIESKVQEKRISQEFNWIPLGTTKRLKEMNSNKQEENCMNELEADINDIDETLDFVFEKLNKMK